MVRSLLVFAIALSISACGITLCQSNSDCHSDEVCQLAPRVPVGQCVPALVPPPPHPPPADPCAAVTCSGLTRCDPADGTCHDLCGGPAGLTCDPSEYCHDDGSSTGAPDGLGVCRVLPWTQEGCDGDTLDEETEPEPTSDFSCINEALQTQFPTCIASTNQVDCESNGGSWERVGRIGTFACVCPTGEENCVCDESSDCLSGLCMTPPDPDKLACPSQTGRCAARNAVFGCFCNYIRPGEILGQCVD